MRTDLRIEEAKRLKRIERLNAIGEILTFPLCILALMFVLFVGVV